MQTFLTHESYYKTFWCLDDARMRNQFEEGIHLLRVRLGLETGYASHPAAKMWIGREHALAVYCWQSIAERLRRYGRRCPAESVGRESDPLVRMNRTLSEGAALSPFRNPAWWGDRDFLRSHRSALVRKAPEHYGPLFGATAPPLMPYLWPIPTDETGDDYVLYISKPDQKRLREGELTLPDEFLDTREYVTTCPI